MNHKDLTKVDGLGFFFILSTVKWKFLGFCLYYSCGNFQYALWWEYTPISEQVMGMTNAMKHLHVYCKVVSFKRSSTSKSICMCRGSASYKNLNVRSSNIGMLVVGPWNEDVPEDRPPLEEETPWGVNCYCKIKVTHVSAVKLSFILQKAEIRHLHR